MPQAHALLQARSGSRPLCANNLRHAAADILPNVMQKFFVAQIQPGAAALHRSYHEMLPPLRDLEATLDAVLPQDYRQWRDTRDGLLSNGADAPRRHVTNIQAVLEPCG